MAPLDPTRDFQDDGGTPGWRANRATNDCRPQPRVVDVTPIGWRHWWPRFVRWFNRTPTWKFLAWAAFLGFGLPWIVLIGGILGAYMLGLGNR